MPLLHRCETEEEQQEQDWEKILQDIENSPQYKLLRASPTESRTSRLHGSDYPNSSPLRGRESVDTDRNGPLSSPLSDETVRPSGEQDSNGGIAISGGEGRSSPGSDSTAVASSSSSGGETRHSSLSGKLSAEAPAFQPVKYGFAVPGQNVSQGPASHSARSFGTIFTEGLPAPGQYRSASGEDIHNLLSSAQMGNGTAGDTRGAQGPVTPKRLARMCSRSSIISSPLGPGHFNDDLGADRSGLLVSPSPAPRNRNQRQNLNTGYMPATTPTRMSSHLAPTMSPSHTRHLTDPFMDSRPAQSPVTPGRGPLGQPINSPARPQSYPQFHPSPGVQAQARQDLPIPPPPLPGIAVRLHHTPAARQRLDARKTIREAWIRTEAQKIAHLNRVVFLAAQKYNATNTRVDFDAWQSALAALNDAVNLEKRMEERRNLFLPQGKSALKMGAGNMQGDAFAGAIAEEGKQKLLGFRMAIMERVCVEGMTRDEAGNVAALATMGEETPVRKQILAGFKAATERRMRENVGNDSGYRRYGGR